MGVARQQRLAVQLRQVDRIREGVLGRVEVATEGLNRAHVHLEAGERHPVTGRVEVVDRSNVIAECVIEVGHAIVNEPTLHHRPGSVGAVEHGDRLLNDVERRGGTVEVHHHERQRRGDARREDRGPEIVGIGDGSAQRHVGLGEIGHFAMGEAQRPSRLHPFDLVGRVGDHGLGCDRRRPGVHVHRGQYGLRVGEFRGVHAGRS